MVQNHSFQQKIRTNADLAGIHDIVNITNKVEHEQAENINNLINGLFNNNWHYNSQYHFG